MACDQTTIAKLEQLLAAIKKFPDPRRAMTEWKQAFRLLQHAGLPEGRITGVVGMRDVPGLEALIEQLRSPAIAPAYDAPRPDEDTCRKALHAFRKRLALTVLDEESQLGHGPFSSGASATSAITPPDDWPAAVWEELARQGKLKYIGHGFYELVKH